MYLDPYSYFLISMDQSGCIVFRDAKEELLPKKASYTEIFFVGCSCCRETEKTRTQA